MLAKLLSLTVQGIGLPMGMMGIKRFSIVATLTIASVPKICRVICPTLTFELGRWIK
jgi:hypothetical protein